MISKIKNKWHDQYQIAANKEYSEFIYALERGGDESLNFIKENERFVTSVLENRMKIEDIIQNIQNNHESTENKRWFFTQAMKHRMPINNILRKKFELTLRFAEQVGFCVNYLTPETFYPALLETEISEAEFRVKEEVNTAEEVVKAEVETEEAEGNVNTEDEKEEVNTAETTEESPIIIEEEAEEVISEVEVKKTRARKVSK